MFYYEGYFYLPNIFKYLNWSFSNYTDLPQVNNRDPRRSRNAISLTLTGLSSFSCSPMHLVCIQSPTQGSGHHLCVSVNRRHSLASLEPFVDKLCHICNNVGFTKQLWMIERNCLIFIPSMCYFLQQHRLTHSSQTQKEPLTIGNSLFFLKRFSWIHRCWQGFSLLVWTGGERLLIEEHFFTMGEWIHESPKPPCIQSPHRPLNQPLPVYIWGLILQSSPDAHPHL